MKTREVYCKSILSKSGLYGIDYAVNPYTGCEHGCIYCYAVFMKKFTERREEWGEFVDIKLNAPRVLAKQIKKSKKGSILFSSVTDPYQPLEKKYEITKKCLHVLFRHDFPLSFLTKSDLILRDRELIEKMNATVGVTFTTVDEKVRKIFEPRASPIENRLKILDEIENSYVFFGPIIPFFSDSEKKLREAFASFEEKDVKHVHIDKMNIYPNVWRRLRKHLDSKMVKRYKKIKNSEKHPRLLKKRVLKILEDFNFEYHLEW
ncbi:MAG: radical SAM protein [Euryarchaeota archaeon]|nr:radical SAM protein [Euryarchaeota archaeon]